MDKIVAMFKSEEELQTFINGQTNNLINQELKKYEKCLTKKDIDRIIGFADSYNRWNVFIETVLPRLPVFDKIYWYALKSTYSSCDNLYQYKDEVKKAFSLKIPARKDLMSKEEKEYLKALPDTVTIYRGMTVAESESKDYGISWTLSKDTAEFFAYHYMRNHSTNHMQKTVQELTIQKKDIIAILLDRQEFEVIYINK